MINWQLLIPLLCLLVSMIHCSVDSVAGGSDNPDFIVAGVIVDTAGHPAQNAVITIASAAYNPITGDAPEPGMTDTTDASGEYSLKVNQTGLYSVRGVHLQQRTRLITTDISVTNDTTYVAKDTLTTPGTIKISLTTLPRDETTGYIYIPGTEIYTFINNDIDTVVLDSVPAGILPSLSYAATSTASPVAIRHELTVTSGDTTTVLNPLWKYSQQLFLNTTVTGANISENILGFPVVIKLSNDNFDFSAARPNGTDIRFTKKDNTILSHEIDQWDSTNQRAVLWVRVDTVHGNDSEQSIIMYWGNPGQTELSSENNAAVFDTAEGFQGVWHFDDVDFSKISDATVNRYDGTCYGMDDASTVDGMIGNARHFNGSSSHIALTGTANSTLNFPENSNYTLSAWIVASMLDSTAHYIISKSNRNYNLDLSGHNLWEIYDLRSTVGWESNYATAQTGMWIYLTGVRSGNTMRLYVNGECVDSTVDTTTSASLRDTTFDVCIGKRAESDYGYWSGIIDEVTISNRSRSADWIRLCYMNQRESNLLVQRKGIR